MTLDQLRRIALALPEATESPHFDRTSFRVRGKIFATVPPDGETVNVFLDEPARERALVVHPDCATKLFWGRKACGVCVTLSRATPAIARSLLAQAWAYKAPKSLRPATPIE